ncbi:hypothetical protein CRUP_018447 [Coryphaenoides rupestris]|nr:hypothetical protein CRUP_018447 [Coryphaenoides rupestris]
MMSLWLLTATLCVTAGVRGCGLPAEWRPLSDACRAELAEVIVYAKVLAIHHREPPPPPPPPQHQHHQQHHQHHHHQHHQHQHDGSVHNSLPFLDPYGYGSEGAEEGLLYTAEVELVCDQAWGSMLEVPAGSRLNVTGLGYLSCHSHTVVQNESYVFFLRMDENYNILPHGVNFQDAIFPDTPDNQRVFASLFQFSNCSSSSSSSSSSSLLLHPQNHLHPPGLDWLQQDDTRPHPLLC